MIKYVNICTKETISNCVEKYTRDIEYFSNKCYNNYCIFNNETNIIHCDDIYTIPR